MADMNKINNIEKHLTNEELGKVNGGRREKNRTVGSSYRGR